jgi:DNA repair exonuclease SbcCD nuclease subunit
MDRQENREIVLVHSSDLHVDHPLFAGAYDGLLGLERVLAAAARHAADAVLLAGDTFDNARVPTQVLRRARSLLADAGRSVVLLPGNHDPVQENCLFRRAGLLDLPDVHVLGINCDRYLRPEIGLEVYGLPHRDFADFEPVPPARQRAARWQVLMAHGHYVAPGEEALHAHRAWRFDDAALGACGADYVALGHWDRPVRVGEHGVLAYYSGSPDLAGTVNLVRLHEERGVSVTRESI